MELKYKTIDEMGLNDIKEDLERQKELIDDRLNSINRKKENDQLIDALSKTRDISTALIPLQQSLNLVWKRTQQIEEDLKKMIDKH